MIETINGIVVDDRKSKIHNTAQNLASIISWYKLDRPKNLAFYDLCTELVPPHNLRSLLGLGLKYFSAPQLTYKNSNRTLKRLKR